MNKQYEDFTKEELIQRLEATDGLVEQIQKELYEANKHLRHLSQIDDLTSTLNKRYMTQKITEAMSTLTGEDHWLSLMMIDIDDFKKVNDRFGHLAGDRLLAYVGQVIQRNLAEGDVVARWGGDEFLVMLKNKHTDEVQQTAYNVQEELRQTDDVHFKNITLSIGFAHIYQPAKTEKAIDLVDKLMYIAKNTGKNKVVF